MNKYILKLNIFIMCILINGCSISMNFELYNNTQENMYIYDSNNKIKMVLQNDNVKIFENINEPICKIKIGNNLYVYQMPKRVKHLIKDYSNDGLFSINFRFQIDENKNIIIIPKNIKFPYKQNNQPYGFPLIPKVNKE